MGNQSQPRQQKTNHVSKRQTTLRDIALIFKWVESDIEKFFCMHNISEFQFTDTVHDPALHRLKQAQINSKDLQS